MSDTPESFFTHPHIVLYSDVGMAYIQFHMVGGGLENYSAVILFETATIILAMTTISGAVIKRLVVKFAKNNIFTSKVIQILFSYGKISGMKFTELLK